MPPKFNPWPDELAAGQVLFQKTPRVFSIDPNDEEGDEPGNADDAKLLAQRSLVGVLQPSGDVEWWFGELRAFDDTKEIVADVDAAQSAAEHDVIFLRKGHSYKMYKQTAGRGSSSEKAPAAAVTAAAGARPVVPPLSISHNPADSDAPSPGSTRVQRPESPPPGSSPDSRYSVSPGSSRIPQETTPDASGRAPLKLGGKAQQSAKQPWPERVDFTDGIAYERGARVLNIDPQIEEGDAKPDPERERLETTTAIVMEWADDAKESLRFFAGTLRAFDADKQGIPLDEAGKLLSGGGVSNVFFKVRNTFRMYKRVAVSDSAQSQQAQGDSGGIGLMSIPKAQQKPAVAREPGELEKKATEAKKKAFAAIGELTFDMLVEYSELKKSSTISLVSIGVLMLLEEPEPKWQHEVLCEMLRKYEDNDRDEQKRNGDTQPTSTFGFRLQKCLRADLHKKIDVAALAELVAEKKFDVKAAQKKSAAAGILARLVLAIHDLVTAQVGMASDADVKR